MMSSKNIRKMVTTAILIALTVVFQLMRPVLGGSNPVSTYIIGSLVNLCLIVAASAVGLFSGIAVSVIAPLIALWQGHAVAFMVPWIMVGNAVLGIAYSLFAKNRDGNSAGWVRFATVGVVAAIVKYLIIALGQTFMLTSMKGQAFGAAIGVAAAAQVQQIVTAIIGMVLAKLVLMALPKRILQD